MKNFKNSNTIVTSAYNKTEVFEMAYSERELLARIIQCEAGRRR
jgi:hypothetical protein